MNVFAFLATLFGCIAIIAVFVSIAHYDRAELLEQSMEEHQEATQALISHCDALELRNAALESANRYNRAVAAGFMLTARTIHKAEQLCILEAKDMP